MTRPSRSRRKADTKPPDEPSTVRAILSWILETDREFRATQSMVNDTHDRF